MNSQYIELQLSDGTIVYQQIQNGYVQQYVDASGNVLFPEIPIGVESNVINANPTLQAWMS